MKEENAYQKDIASIRELMDRSTKFISLSGLSGVLAGVYALTGATTVYLLRSDYLTQSGVTRVIWIALAVLVSALATGLWLTRRNVLRTDGSLWNATSRRLAINLAIPLLTAGVYIIIQIYQVNYYAIAPACLIFYGLALINASPNLYEEIRYVGYLEIALGLLCAAFPQQGLFFWAAGFGVCHIIYGAIMYKKYDAAANAGGDR